jgi:D-alanyl-D-alanine carboxypeptidase (penicillin-binding protein 5/6)
MNKKAKSLHLDNTLFSNPQGFDDGENYSTVTDLVRLASYSLRSTYIRQIVRTSLAVIHDADNSKSYVLENVNQLLFEHPEIQGIKTGFTEEAGECLISLINKNNHEIIIVLLKSEDRFGETLALSDWVFTNFTWTALAPRQPPEQMP